MKPYHLICIFCLLVITACTPQQSQPTENVQENPLVVEGQQLYKAILRFLSYSRGRNRDRRAFPGRCSHLGG